MKVLVTGGAGFIGSHLVDRLLQEGHQVFCIDNFDAFYARKIKERNIESHLSNALYIFKEMDIRNKEELTDLFKENGFDVVYHLAAKAGVRPSIQNPQDYEDVNIRGTLNLLECAAKFGVSNFLFASSSSIYGINNKIPFSEEDKVEHLISPYAVTKRSGELFCYTYHHLYNLPITCLRFFTVYGPRQRPEMAIHKFTEAIAKGNKLSLYGDGSSKRDYTYIDDIIDGLHKLLDKPRPFDIVNLGNSKVVTLKELVLLIEKNLNKKANVEWFPDQPGDVPITYSDISKAERLFGYQPETDIGDGIAKFVQWYKDEFATP